MRPTWRLVTRTFTVTLSCGYRTVNREGAAVQGDSKIRANLTPGLFPAAMGRFPIAVEPVSQMGEQRCYKDEPVEYRNLAR